MSSQETLPQTFESNRQWLKQAATDLDLPDAVFETAVTIYTQVYREDLYHGRSIDTILSACLQLSCRIEQHAMNPSEIAIEFESDRKHILQTARHFESKLGLKTPPTNPQDFIDDFCETLSLSETTCSLAHKITNSFLDSDKFSGKSPTGIAAGSIYAATKETNDRVTQKKLAETSNVSEVTIRNIYQMQQKIYANQNTTQDTQKAKQVVTND